jgi:hypothetical protein
VGNADIHDAVDELDDGERLLQRLRRSEDRLKLDDILMKMRQDCDRLKEQLRQTIIARYKIEPPGGVHVAPKPVIYRP